MNTTMPDLPLDLVDPILDALQNDHTALKQCALVSRSFLVPSLKRLFSSLYISRAAHKDLRHLQETLTSRPTIFGYIKELRVSGSVVAHTDNPFFRFLLPGLIERANLRVLRIDTTAWESFHTDSQSLFIDLLRSCPLHTVNLMRICGHTFPLQVFGEMKALRHLGFLGDHSAFCGHAADPVCTIPEAQPPSEVVPAAVPLPGKGTNGVFLETLHVGGHNSAELAAYLADPECPLKTTQLKELRVSGASVEEVMAIEEIIKHGAESIQSFHWTAYGWRDGGPQINMRRLTRLRRLSLRSTPSTLSFFRHFDMPGDNLSELNLIEDSGTCIKEILKEDNEIFAVLQKQAALPRLCRLRMVVSSDPEQHVEPGLLPSLFESGKFTLEVGVDADVVMESLAFRGLDI